MQDGITIIHWLAAATFPLAVAYAAVSDFRTLEIPNWTSLAVAASFLPAALIGGAGYPVIAMHYGIGFALLAGGAFLFARGLIGGGDVKLLAAAGVWMGFNDLAAYLALVALIGGGLALAVLILRRFSGRPGFLETLPWIGREMTGDEGVPYGVAIGLAAILLFSRSAVLPRPLAEFLAY